MRVFCLLCCSLFVSAACVRGAWDDPYRSGENSSSGGDFASEFGVDDAYVFDEGAGLDASFASPDYDAGYSAAVSPSSEAASRHPFSPYDAYGEFVGNMSLSSQHSRTKVYNAYLSVPVLHPSRFAWGRWHADVRLNARVTWIRSKGEDVLGVEHLYTYGLRASLIRMLGDHSQLQLGATPQLSSDFDHLSGEDFYWGGYAAFSSKWNDRFYYSLGVAVMPDYYKNYVMPLLSFTYRCSDGSDWRLRGSRLSYVRRIGQSFEWGPFAQWNSGVWTVNRFQTTRQFRMTNVILGLGCGYDFASGACRVRGVLDMGSSVYNTFRVRDKGGEHTLEKYRGHAAVYARAGVQVSF